MNILCYVNPLYFTPYNYTMVFPSHRAEFHRHQSNSCEFLISKMAADGTGCTSASFSILSGKRRTVSGPVKLSGVIVV